jgi:hypothetical protein
MFFATIALLCLLTAVVAACNLLVASYGTYTHDSLEAASKNSNMLDR